MLAVILATQMSRTRLSASARSTWRSSAAAASARCAFPVLRARWNWAYRWPCDVTANACSHKGVLSSSRPGSWGVPGRLLPAASPVCGLVFGGDRRRLAWRRPGEGARRALFSGRRSAWRAYGPNRFRPSPTGRTPVTLGDGSAVLRLWARVGRRSPRGGRPTSGGGSVDRPQQHWRIRPRSTVAATDLGRLSRALPSRSSVQCEPRSRPRSSSASMVVAQTRASASAPASGSSDSQCSRKRRCVHFVACIGRRGLSTGKSRFASCLAVESRLTGRGCRIPRRGRSRSVR